MMMDEEARTSLMKEIDQSHKADQQQLAARLKQVDLEIDEDGSGSGQGVSATTTTTAAEPEESKEE